MKNIIKKSKNQKIKKSIIFTLFLTFALIVSGCAKIQPPKPIVNNNQPVNENVNTNVNTNTNTSANTNQNIGEENIDISNWQTYRNKEYGFEVKYPNKWTVEEKKNDNTGKASLTFSNYSNFHDFNKGNDPGDLFLYFFSIYNKDNKEAVNEYKKIKEDAIGFYNQKKEYNINDTDEIILYMITNKSEIEDKTWDLILPIARGFLENDKYAYRFYHGTELKGQKKSMEYLKSSLGTFKISD